MGDITTSWDGVYSAKFTEGNFGKRPCSLPDRSSRILWNANANTMSAYGWPGRVPLLADPKRSEPRTVKWQAE